MTCIFAADCSQCRGLIDDPSSCARHNLAKENGGMHSVPSDLSPVDYCRAAVIGNEIGKAQEW